MTTFLYVSALTDEDRPLRGRLLHCRVLRRDRVGGRTREAPSQQAGPFPLAARTKEMR